MQVVVSLSREEAVLEALEGLSVEVERAGSILEVRVGSDYLLKAASRLKRAGFDHVKTVIAVDEPDRGGLEVIVPPSQPR